jgi:hypothetical protein
MILGVKCEGCKMWSRLTNTLKLDILRETYERDGSVSYDIINTPYYCDECMQNVTYHETKATITVE